MSKYDANVLLDFLNEGLLDIAENSALLVKTGYAILKEGDTSITIPSDFKGFYRGKNSSVGNATNTSTQMDNIHLIPHRTGIRLKTAVSGRDIGLYKSRVEGVILDNNIINELVKSGQIVAPVGGGLIVDLLVNRILIEYEYTPLTPELTLDDEINHRELMYLLKWWTCANALYADMHNEASNLASIYEKKYLRRLENAGQMMHNWNEVSLTPYAPNGGYR